MISASLISLSIASTFAQGPTYAVGRRYAVVVGISDYTKKPGYGGFSSISCGHSDAIKVADHLKATGWNVSLIQRGDDKGPNKATKNEILTELAMLKTEPQDTVLFYFSGHGLEAKGNVYLAPSDAYYELAKGKGENWRPNLKSLLSPSDLIGQFQKIRAMKRIIITDSQRVFQSNDKYGDVVDMPMDLTNVAGSSRFGAPSWAVFYACQSGELAFETTEGGVFTNAFLSALQEKTNQDATGESVLELVASDTQQKTRRFAIESGKKFLPEFRMRSTERLVMGRKSTLGEVVTIKPPKK